MIKIIDWEKKNLLCYVIKALFGNHYSEKKNLQGFMFSYREAVTCQPMLLLAIKAHG